MNWKYLIFAIFVQLLVTIEARRDPPEVIKDGSAEGVEKDFESGSPNVLKNLKNIFFKPCFHFNFPIRVLNQQLRK